MLIVITGLELRSSLYKPIFLYHAVRSYSQAQAAQGNLHVDQRQINGVHHTVTAWDSAEASAEYGRSAAHAGAVAVFSKIAIGRVYWGDHAEIPNWEDAHMLWAEHGKLV